MVRGEGAHLLGVAFAEGDERRGLLDARSPEEGLPRVSGAGEWSRRSAQASGAGERRRRSAEASGAGERRRRAAQASGGGEDVLGHARGRERARHAEEAHLQLTAERASDGRRGADELQPGERHWQLLE